MYFQNCWWFLLLGQTYCRVLSSILFHCRHCIFISGIFINIYYLVRHGCHTVTSLYLISFSPLNIFLTGYLRLWHNKTQHFSHPSEQFLLIFLTCKRDILPYFFMSCNFLLKTGYSHSAANLQMRFPSFTLHSRCTLSLAVFRADNHLFNVYLFHSILSFLNGRNCFVITLSPRNLPQGMLFVIFGII